MSRASNVGHGPQEWFWPHPNRKCLNILKMLNPPLNNLYFFFTSVIWYQIVCNNCLGGDPTPPPPIKRKSHISWKWVSSLSLNNLICFWPLESTDIKLCVWFVSHGPQKWSWHLPNRKFWPLTNMKESDPPQTRSAKYPKNGWDLYP